MEAVTDVAKMLERLHQLLEQVDEIDRLATQIIDAGQTQQLDVLLRAKRALCEKIFETASGIGASADLETVEQVMADLRRMQESHERLVHRIATARQQAAGLLAEAQKHQAAVDAYVGRRAA